MKKIWSKLDGGKLLGVIAKKVMKCHEISKGQESTNPKCFIDNFENSPSLHNISKIYIVLTISDQYLYYDLKISREYY